jgi:predicted transcriptional regulator
LVSDLKFKDITFYNLSVYDYNLHDKQQCIITGWAQFFFLTIRQDCLTMYDMKTSSLTIRLDKDLEALLAKASRRSGKNRSVIARDALRRQLRLEQFEEVRKRVMPFAEARGYLTDEDIFSEIS